MSLLPVGRRAPRTQRGDEPSASPFQTHEFGIIETHSDKIGIGRHDEALDHVTAQPDLDYWEGRLSRLLEVLMGLLDDAIREHLELKRAPRRRPRRGRAPGGRGAGRSAQRRVRPARGHARAGHGRDRRRARRGCSRWRRSRRPSRRRPRSRSPSPSQNRATRPGCPTSRSTPSRASRRRSSRRPRWSPSRTSCVPTTSPAPRRTCSRRRPTSSRRPPSTTGSGSSRSRRAVSISTSRAAPARMAARRYTLLDVFTVHPAAGQPARRGARRRRRAGPRDARVRARDAAVGDVVHRRRRPPPAPTTATGSG